VDHVSTSGSCPDAVSGVGWSPDKVMITAASFGSGIDG
jgi:hypothetical protein